MSILKIRNGNTWESIPVIKGEDGYTPVKGTDYWTAADKAEVVADTAAAIDLDDYVKNTDYATSSVGGVVKVTDSTYGLLISGESPGELRLRPAYAADIKSGSDLYKPIAPGRQHMATFYGLAKAAGDSTQSSSNNEVGIYTSEAKSAIKNMLDIPVNSYDLNIGESITASADLDSYTTPGTYSADSTVISSITNAPTTTTTYKLVVEQIDTNTVRQTAIIMGDVYQRVGDNSTSTWEWTEWVKSVRNIDYATSSIGGVVKIDETYGLYMNDGVIRIKAASENDIIKGTSAHKTIVAGSQHLATFYGLVKAAVNGGIYSADAKAAINTMLGSVSKDSLDNAGISARSYTTKFGGEFSVTTVDDVDYLSPHALASVTGRIRKANLHRVTFNGTEYILQTRLWYDINSLSGFSRIKVYEYLGNLGLYIDSLNGVPDGTDDVPFIIISDLDDNNSIDVLTETAGTYTILVEQINETKVSLPKSLIYGDSYSPFEKSNLDSSTYNGLSFGVNEITNKRGTFSIGYANKLSNEFSIAIGTANTVSGSCSIALGTGCLSDTANMVAVGSQNAQSNDPDEWQHDTAYKYGDFVKGRYMGLVDVNAYCIKDHTSPSSGDFNTRVNDERVWRMTLASDKDTLFVVGNGELRSRSNAFKVNWGGTGRFGGDVYARCEDDSTGGNKLISEADYASSSNVGVIKTHAYYGTTMATEGSSVLSTYPASANDIKTGSTPYRPIGPATQHSSVFYGLAKAAGADMKDSSNAVGTYTDAAKTAIRSMLGAIGTTDYATSSTGGVIKMSTHGVMLDNGVLQTNDASSAEIKAGTTSWRVLNPSRQHEAVFYGLAKVAGQDMASSSNTVGTYTDEAKTAIQSMLGIGDAIADYVDGSNVVNVVGTSVTLTAEANTRYVCGEMLSLSITPPSVGITSVTFTSGSTTTVLTLPNTVKMPEWWGGVEANYTYEICITDGVYAGVMSWPV